MTEAGMVPARVDWDKVTERVRRDDLARRLRLEAARLDSALIAFRAELGTLAELLRTVAAELNQ